MKKVPFKIDNNRIKCISFKNTFTNYYEGSRYESGYIHGFGEMFCRSPEMLPFDVTLEAILFDKRGNICKTATVTYDGVFRSSGYAAFEITMDGITSDMVGRIKFVIIAKSPAVNG